VPSISDQVRSARTNEWAFKKVRISASSIVTSVHLLHAEIDRVLKGVLSAVGLEYGKNNRVVFLDAAELEQFRPIGRLQGWQASGRARVPTHVRQASHVPYNRAAPQDSCERDLHFDSYEER
jgi:hypothetical protein